MKNTINQELIAAQQREQSLKSQLSKQSAELRDANFASLAATKHLTALQGNNVSLQCELDHQAKILIETNEALEATKNQVTQLQEQIDETAEELHELRVVDLFDLSAGRLIAVDNRATQTSPAPCPVDLHTSNEGAFEWRQDKPGSLLMSQSTPEDVVSTQNCLTLDVGNEQGQPRLGGTNRLEQQGETDDERFSAVLGVQVRQTIFNVNWGCAHARDF